MTNIGMNAYFKHKQPSEEIKKKQSLTDYQKELEDTKVDEDLANSILNL